ncbi:uncharacterized protein LOC120000674 [Tripterygium wilfordii]|uniref:uncharacterized protein LOC120000674 n=1 Tax=Tripterygium wilfordii TaxID=458696 RepID=UPI0018F853D3|nr:uncharacterized protein LOC120000674 [Tripterygium wilfordii]
MDKVDEFIKIRDSTEKETLLKFCKNVIQLYTEQYLRSPNMYDTQQLMNENAQRGFLGMLGSFDCMHWEWHGGMTRAIHRKRGGHTPNMQFIVNSHVHHTSYYLIDGKYPQYATLMQSISHPHTAQDKVFARAQESVCTDVERAFGVLQARWGFTRGPVTFYDTVDLRRIMMTCIILHNMIIEDERHIDIDPWVPPPMMKCLQSIGSHPLLFSHTTFICAWNKYATNKVMQS